MSTEAKPGHTPGALRAAKIIRRESLAGPHSKMTTAEDYAQVIDQETAAPELLGAAELLVDAYGGMRSMRGECTWCGTDPCAPYCAVNKARAAIAKAEGEA